MWTPSTAAPSRAVRPQPIAQRAARAAAGAKRSSGNRAVQLQISSDEETLRGALRCGVVRSGTEEESAPLLDHLAAVVASEQYHCRFQWRTGSLALWDNRCTQ